MTPARQPTLWATLALVASWASASDLAESLWRADAANSPPYCSGNYAEPETPLPRNADSAAEPVELAAQQLQSTLGATSTVTGGVVVRQGNRLLTAEHFDIDERTSRIVAPSGLRLSEPGLHVVAQAGTVDLTADRADLTDAAFVLTDTSLRGTAARIQRRGDDLHFQQTTLTGCPPQNNTWVIRVAEVRISEQDALAHARHARIELRSVPIFYTPYLRFPLRGERASGFLFPNLAHHNDDGLDVSIPYYFNLAPNYDAMLTPRLIAKRGTGLEAEFRHLTRRARNDFSAAVLTSDARYNGELPRDDFLTLGGTAADFAPADRWLVAGNHQGRYGPWRTLIDYTAVSDNDYFIDLGSEVAVASRVSLDRRAEIQYARGGLFARLWAQAFQRLEPGVEPYRRLPEANLSYAGGLWGPFAWSLGTSWSSFQRNALTRQRVAPPRGIAGITGRRLHIEPRLRLPLSRPWGFLNLSAGLRHTDYALDNTPPSTAANPTRNVPVASVDAGLFFERDLASGWIQTLEPRLYYLYQAYEYQDDLPRFDAAMLTFSYRQLFRDNRFAGLDRIGDANRVAIGVTSRLLNATTGAERLTARLGTTGYLRDRRVTLAGQPGADERQSTSALAGEVRARVGPLALTSTFAWDHHAGELDETGFGVMFGRDNQRIVNVGYRRRMRYDVDQTDVSFYWPLAPRWYAFGRWNHDWRFGQNIERFAGIEYASCCLAVKLAWHETIDIPRNRLTPDADFDRGVLLQIALRGLGGFGTKVDSRLERGIKGYRMEESYR